MLSGIDKSVSVYCSVPHDYLLAVILFDIHVNDISQVVSCHDSGALFVHKEILIKFNICDWFIDNEISIKFGENKNKVDILKKNVNTPNLKIWIYADQKTF